MHDLDARLRALAAAAVLQRVRWAERSVDVPLARPHRVDPDEVVLKLAGGGWLIVSHVPNATSLRAAMRRWAREAEDGPILALILADREIEEAILEEPPERPSVRMRVALLSTQTALWEQAWPALADVLSEAARRRPPPPDSVLDKLRAREGQGWPERATPPPSPTFNKLVFALAQAHDLVRLVRGEARLRLRSGGHLTVLAGSGEPETDDPALAAALARIAAGMAGADDEPGLIVVDGPEDLLERVQQVLGRSARLGRVNTVSTGGAVKPADPELQQLVRLAMAWEGSIELFSLLETGLSRTGGRTVDRGAAAAGEQRLGLIRGLLNSIPGVRLGWLEKRGAELWENSSALRVRWVGPDGGRVEDVLARWRLAAIAARWTGHTVDLLLAGGDQATWDRIRKALGGAPEGHVFHLDGTGSVRTRAGLFGPLRPVARALRRLARRPKTEQRCTLDELQHDLDRSAEADFRSSVMDAAFLERLSAVTPWATRGVLGAIVVAYAMQLRWDAPGAFQEAGGALLVRMGALTGEGLWPLLMSEPWRLLSSSFLHAAWWHIGLNAYALWILGRRLEALLGPERLILLYVASCLGGSVLHEAVSGGGGTLAVGASTGVLGLLAAQGALTLFKPDLMPPRIRKLLWREAWLNGVLIAAISLLPFVGGILHLGGALTGFGLVATGLITRGIGPATALDVGPTRVRSPAVLRPLAAAVGAIAVGAAVIATVMGRPWDLSSPEGRVQEVSFFDGALTVPVPGRSPVPTEQRVLPDGAVQVVAGDPLRDGLRVRYTARRVPGARGIPDLDDVAAVYGDGSPYWVNVEVGGHAAAQLPVSRPDGKVHGRWLISRDGVVVDVELEALPDADRTRLAGSWTRLAAGVEVGEGWQDRPVDPRLQHLRLARAGVLADPSDRILQAIVLVDEDRDAARARLDPALGGKPLGRERAMRLSRVVDGEAAALLSGRALAHADAAEKEDYRGLYVMALIRAGRFADAVDEADHRVARAQALWYAGRDSEAVDQASLWRSEIPWWVWLDGFGGELPEPYATDLAWAEFLAGDAEDCAERSVRVVRAYDTLIARFNAGTCQLAAGDAQAAKASFDEALERATKLGDRRVLAGVQADLHGLVDREVEGAAELLERVRTALPEPEPEPEPKNSP